MTGQFGVLHEPINVTGDVSNSIWRRANSDGVTSSLATPMTRQRQNLPSDCDGSYRDFQLLGSPRSFSSQNSVTLVKDKNPVQHSESWWSLGESSLVPNAAKGIGIACLTVTKGIISNQVSLGCHLAKELKAKQQSLPLPSVSSNEWWCPVDLKSFNNWPNVLEIQSQFWFYMSW